MFTVDGFNSSVVPVADCSPEKEKKIFSRRPSLFFAWAASLAHLDMVLTSLRSTVTDCPNFIRPGYYHEHNTFGYYFDSKDEFAKLSPMIWSDKEVRRHGRVLAIEPLDNCQKTFVLWRYNAFRSRPQKVGVWQKGSLANKFPIKNVMKDFSMDSFTFHVSCIPYDTSFIAEYDWISAQANPRKAFKNFRGAEVDVMTTACKVKTFK